MTLVSVPPLHSTRVADEATATDLFNSYVAANVLVALHSLGVARHLQQESPQTTIELAVAMDANPDLLSALLESARRLGLVAIDGGRWTMRSNLIASGSSSDGFLRWMIRGYGDLMTHLAELATGAMTFGCEVNRNEGEIAASSALVDDALMRPILYRVLERHEMTKIVDFGCGTASRLIALCGRHPHLHGVGVDISEQACALARNAVRESGLERRIDIVCADARSLVRAGDETIGDADVAGSFMMLHDLLDSEEAGAASFLSELREAMPRLRTLLVADTVLMDPDDAPPIFSLGFELVHAFMSTRLYTSDEYERVFANAGFELRERHTFGAPNTWLYILGS